jgi:hypothetical protein
MTSTPMPSPGMTAIRYFFDMLCSFVGMFDCSKTLILFLLLRIK